MSYGDGTLEKDKIGYKGMESSKEKRSVFNFGRGLLEKNLKDVGAIWGEECLQEQGTAEARGMSLICFRNTMGVKCGWNLLSKDTVAGGEVIHLLNKHLLSSNWVSLSSKTLPVLCYCAKSLPLCPTLCDPMDCSPPGSMGFSRQKY